MPSPFPGMDPYLEDPDLWPDVHHNLIGGVQELLNAELRTGRYATQYVARVELRAFMVGVDDPAPTELYVIPDARITTRSAFVATPSPAAAGGGVAVAVAARPATAIDVTDLLLERCPPTIH